MSLASAQTKMAGMVAEPEDLVLPGRGDEVDELRRDDAAVGLVGGPAEVVLPLPVAAPADHDQDAVLVAEVVEGPARAPEALEPEGVEVHVPGVQDLGPEPLGVVVEQEVVGPAAAADEDLAAVELEAAVAVLGPIVGDLPDAEADGPHVRGQDPGHAHEGVAACGLSSGLAGGVSSGLAGGVSGAGSGTGSGAGLAPLMANARDRV